MVLDIPTLLLVATLMAALAASVTLVAWLGDRRQTALLWMAAAPVLAVTGALARALLPFVPAILLGNVAVLSAGAAFWAACRTLRGGAVRLGPFVGPVAVWAVACAFAAFRADLNARVVLISLLGAAQLAMALRELRADRHPRGPAQHALVGVAGTHALVGVAGTHAALLLARAVAATVAWNDQTVAASNFPLVTLASLTLVMLLCLFAALLVKERAGRLLRAEAETDHLTGVANRRQFDRDLAAEIERGLARAAPVALLMIDVDAFKTYNDRYGHAAGDTCLRAVATALGRTAAGRVYRYGGEEFVVLLPGTGVRGAMGVAQALGAAVRALGMTHAGREGGIVTVSLGCASGTPLTAQAGAALLDAADRALYRAKQGGRDRACVAEADGGPGTEDGSGPGRRMGRAGSRPIQVHLLS